MSKVLKASGLILFLALILYMARLNLNPTSSSPSSQTVYFYNWGDYIDPDILSQFEQESGYQVVYESFDSNEAMMTKIEQGRTAYDLTIPSDYTVQLMIEKDLLHLLDHHRIQGMDHIDPRFLDQPFDPANKYSIPYFWGTLGIIYNTQDYEATDLKHWKNLWHPQFNNQIMVYDGAREVLGIGLHATGHSANETDPTILQEAVQSLNQGFMSNVKALLADEIKMYVVQEEAPIAITFSGEAASALDENEDLAYHIPPEGSNIWFDNMVIPKTAQNIEGAYALINFLLRPDIAAQNADYIWYSTPNQTAMDLIDPEARDNEVLYPEEELLDYLEVYEHLGRDHTILFNDLFLELKLSSQS